jgi:hypothetical protein
MKLAIIGSLALSLCSNTHAFAPLRPSASITGAGRSASFSTTTTTTTLFGTGEDLSLEQEVEVMVQAELTKTKRMSNMRNANGVEYAPWMNVTPEDEAKIRTMMREKAAIRRARKQQAQGALLNDSQGQELSGVGLKSRILDNASVELEWTTSAEAATRGFIVKRRPAKVEDFQVLASYESYGPLQTQGVDGGLYRYLDENVGPGSWVYRVTECESSGAENDLSQCLVDITTEEEQKVAKFGLAVFGAVAIAAVAAGVLLDPVQY